MPLWVLRTAFRTVGSVAASVAARWYGAEIARAWPAAELLTTHGLGHRTILRDPEVIRRTVDFLRAGVAG